MLYADNTIFFSDVATIVNRLVKFEHELNSEQPLGGGGVWRRASGVSPRVTLVDTWGSFLLCCILVLVSALLYRFQSDVKWCLPAWNITVLIYSHSFLDPDRSDWWIIIFLREWTVDTFLNINRLTVYESA